VLLQPTMEELIASLGQLGLRTDAEPGQGLNRNADTRSFSPSLGASGSASPLGAGDGSSISTEGGIKSRLGSDVSVSHHR